MALELESILLPLLFLLGASALTMKMKAMLIRGRVKTKKLFKEHPGFFSFNSFLSLFYTEGGWDSILFTMSLTKHILRMLYAITGFMYLISFPFSKELILHNSHPTIAFGYFILEIVIITFVGLAADLVARLFTFVTNRGALNFSTVITLPFLFILCPVTLPLLALQKLFYPGKKLNPTVSGEDKVRERIVELVHEHEISKYLDASDKKLILSMASFRDRIAKEIMVPRIDIFALDIETTVHEAAKAMIPEKYSRIPVYKENIDNMVGVLLYKDVVKLYSDSFDDKNNDKLQQTLHDLITPILFTPETKKISKLLQEFRTKQSHLAIVVDEYGGTEGIVTIEDILEELVGEIADEYDFDEERLFKPFPSGGWIVDARMNILDIQKELNVVIDTSPEYDTIGGFIYHKAGTIPAKGWRLHTDTYNVEVLSSSERSIEKVWIMIPQKKDTEKS